MTKKTIINSFILVALFLLSANVALADKSGDVNSFFVDVGYSADARTRVSATLRYVSDRAYFYVEDNYWKSLDEANKQSDYLNILKELGSEFDNVIYTKLTGFYGKPWEPGIDNDNRVSILLTPLQQDFGGYFYSGNEYDITEVENSNKREMLYLNASHINNYKFNLLRNFFAHEFVHLISFYQKEKTKNVSDDVWLHEMRAEYSSTALSYDSNYPESNLERRAKTFTENFSDPLAEWKNKNSDYAIVMMLAQYIKDQYSDTIFPLTLQDSGVGTTSINNALKQASFTDRFDDIFFNFAIANYLNDASVGDKKYGYKNPNLKNIKLSANYSGSLKPDLKFSNSITLKDWALNYFKYDGFANIVKIHFSKSSADRQQVSPIISATHSFVVGLILENSDGTKSVQKINLEKNEQDLYFSGLGTSVKNLVIVPIAMNKTSAFTASDPSYNLSFSIEATNAVTPSINKLSFYDSLSGGGSVLAISGNNFEQGMKVSFGDIEAKANNVTANFAEVIVPNSVISGIVAVKAVNVSGEKSNPLDFKYFEQRPEGSLIRALSDDRVFIVKGNFIRHIKDAKIFSFYGHLNFNMVTDVSWQELKLYTESNLIKSESSPRVYEIADLNKHWLNITGEQFSVSGRKWDSIFLINKKEFDFYKNGSEVKSGAI